MRLYISGGINGIGNAVERFISAADILCNRGYEPVNPFDVPACQDSPCRAVPAVPGSGTHAWECYLRYDLIAMLRCDGVATLRGWEVSRGARFEVATAVQLGMQVLPLLQWPAIESRVLR